MAELGGGFYDQLKSISSGYANLDYEEGQMRPADLVRLDLLVNGNPIDALARIVHRFFLEPGHKISLSLYISCKEETRSLLVPCKSLPTSSVVITQFNSYLFDHWQASQTLLVKCFC